MNLFAGASLDEGFPVLDQLSWSGGAQGSLRAARLFLESSPLPEMLASWLAARSAPELACIADRSIERTTHFKWFLGGKPGKYTLWLHEYKAPEIFARAVDFAASVHNHRYGFCSRILSGALHVSEFVISEPNEPIKLSATRAVAAGETMLLSHEDVHRVDHVNLHTCTLIIQGPPARNFSTCYNIASGRGRRVYDLQSRLPGVVGRLTAAYGQGVSAR